jgi:hypothetical protein
MKERKKANSSNLGYRISVIGSVSSLHRHEGDSAQSDIDPQDSAKICMCQQSSGVIFEI